ncbi:MAG: hypothetical protein ABTD50_18825 [Polyangiaceae bacterium]
MNIQGGILAAALLVAAQSALPGDARAQGGPQSAPLVDGGARGGPQSAPLVESPADEGAGALLASGVDAIRRGHADDAISSLEALADLGIADPVASFDRGLAYALRVRVGGESPGDLGRAVHGLEEARDLTHSRALAEDASRALSIVRAEIVRRRLRAGESIETEPSRSLARSVVELVDENSWALGAASASWILSLGLFVHWLARARRLRIAAGIGVGVATPVLLVMSLMTLAARHDRWQVEEAIVVVPSARVTDERGVARPSSVPLPEGARVEVVEQRGAVTRVRFGRADVWIASSALRGLARAR